MESPAVTHPEAAADLRPATAGLPRSPLVVGRAYFLAIILVIFVGYLTYCAFNFGMTRFETADEKRVKEREKILSDRLSDDAKWLHDAPGWFNKEKGLVRVPIDEAMRMTATELASATPHPADLIAANPGQPSGAPPSPVTPPNSAVPALPPGASAPAAAPTPAAGTTVPLPGSNSTPAPAAPSPATIAPIAATAQGAPSPASPAPSPDAK